MKVWKYGVLLLMIGAASGCGSVFNFGDDKDEESSTDATANAAKKPTPAPIPKAFEGYVGGTFEVTVDGVVYADMEDFYTKEEARLPEKVRQAGYDDSWSVEFKAAVGFSDLWHDMTVYLSPVDNAGYQGETKVGEGGHFSLAVPNSGLDHDYKVRANKRIGIVLTRGEARHEICYNFSGLEKSVTFGRDTLPVILDAFVSTITSYDCANEPADGSGVKVPSASGKIEGLSVGQTKSDATRILGLKGLAVESPTSWCWAYRPTPDSVCAEARTHTEGAPICDCRVTFDEGGVVTALDGISKSYTATP